eukprot:CAMPEP_0172609174 /NCGR_PEP_ID=MMETSP1068-20121228/29194_1 /TAXON_ID=35684 /ORGANISM="Pseudopedinella elastica, Strain CCMP716" /LENGTH=104 /DNA_ID=CAMNT_0013412641 /DNA_START=61 /DNA_END=375 /DNA_ORIENTATION=-
MFARLIKVLFAAAVCSLSSGLVPSHKVTSTGATKATSSRREFASALGWAAGLAATAPALAKGDPYEGCLSKCIYFCTKPKGDEQKSRADCYPECKRECKDFKSK